MSMSTELNPCPECTESVSAAVTLYRGRRTGRCWASCDASPTHGPWRNYQHPARNSHAEAAAEWNAWATAQTNIVHEVYQKQPVDAETGRFVCTKTQPMRPTPYGNSPDRWMHPDAKDTGRESAHFDFYHCPNCGLNFSVEVAD